MIKPVDPGRPICSITHITDRPTPEHTMKRQSTTAKLTAATVRLIAAAIARGEGVIIRWQGEEFGCYSLSGNRRHAYCIAADGSEHIIPLYDRPAPTIRKATIDALHDAAVIAPQTIAAPHRQPIATIEP